MSPAPKITCGSAPVAIAGGVWYRFCSKLPRVSAPAIAWSAGAIAAPHGLASWKERPRRGFDTANLQAGRRVDKLATWVSDILRVLLSQTSECLRVSRSGAFVFVAYETVAARLTELLISSEKSSSASSSWWSSWSLRNSGVSCRRSIFGTSDDANSRVAFIFGGTFWRYRYKNNSKLFNKNKHLML